MLLGNVVGALFVAYFLAVQTGVMVLCCQGYTLVVIVVAQSLGATPQDLIAILQALTVAGSLKAELEII
mgnify:CR=1 FL=1